jgi:hypothetical protein
MIPAAFDGMYQRKIKQTTFHHTSAIRYRYSINMVTTIVFLFFFSVFFPIAMPSYLVPIGFAIIAFSLSIILANMQKKI